MATPNISLAQFNKIATGDYNAGQVDFRTKDDGSTELVKVNNFVWRTSKNNVVLSHERILEVKEVKGLGQTMDMILYSGTLKTGQTVAIGTNGAPLVTRIKAILRRTSVRKKQSEDQSVISSGDLTMDRENRRVTVSGREINLTSKEFELLELLATNPGKVYGRTKLLETVWGRDYPGDVRTVDVHIRRLREKIEPNPSEPRYVQTKWGVGYYFRQNEK